MRFSAVYRRMRLALTQLRKGRKEIVKHMVFVSAEGSYSSAVFGANASVLIAGRMYSDRTRTPVIWEVPLHLSPVLTKMLRITNCSVVSAPLIKPVLQRPIASTQYAQPMSRKMIYRAATD